jgi:cellulase/cellobiase CelA1
MAAISAAARSQVALRASTTLDEATALTIVRDAAGAVKGGGMSLLTSGIANVGATVNVEVDGPDGLGLSITSGKRIVELCTFSARARAENGKTSLTVGGLERYKTNQSKMLGFIPAGPKYILGYDIYKRFLDTIAAGLRARDPAATVTITGPGGG